MLGPLFGALVLAVADWRAIFLINLVVGLVLAAAIQALAPRARWFRGRLRSNRPRNQRSAQTTTSSAPSCSSSPSSPASLVFIQPSQLLRDLTWGQLFIPFAGESRWLTPLGVVAIAAAVLFVVRCATARRPLVDLPRLDPHRPRGRPGRRAVPRRRTRPA